MNLSSSFKVFFPISFNSFFFSTKEIRFLVIFEVNKVLTYFNSMVGLTLNLIKAKIQVRDLKEKCFEYKYIKHLSKHPKLKALFVLKQKI